MSTSTKRSLISELKSTHVHCSRLEYLSKGVYPLFLRVLFFIFLFVLLFLFPIKLLFPRTRNDVSAWLLISNNSKYDIYRFYWIMNILCFWFYGIFHTGYFFFSFLLKVAKNSLELEKWTENRFCTWRSHPMNISTSIRYRHTLIHCSKPRVSKMKNLQKQTAIGPRCRMVREDLSTYFGTFARHESWMFSVLLQSALALSLSPSLYLSLSASSHSRSSNSSQQLFFVLRYSYALLRASSGVG